MSTASQPLDLSFLAGLNPDLYHSIGHSLGIFNDNGKLSVSMRLTYIESVMLVLGLGLGLKDKICGLGVGLGLVIIWPWP